MNKAAILFTPALSLAALSVSSSALALNYCSNGYGECLGWSNSDHSREARGLYGFASDGAGVAGESTRGYAVSGLASNTGEGVRGESGYGIGVHGHSDFGIGVYGNSGTSHGVEGVAN